MRTPIRLRSRVLSETVAAVSPGPIARAVLRPQRAFSPTTDVPTAPRRTAMALAVPQTMLWATKVPDPPSTRMPARPLPSASPLVTDSPGEGIVWLPEGEAPLMSGWPSSRKPLPAVPCTGDRTEADSAAVLDLAVGRL